MLKGAGLASVSKHTLRVVALVATATLYASASLATPSAATYREELASANNDDLNPQWNELLELARHGTPREIVQASSDFLLLAPEFAAAHLVRAEAYQSMPDSRRAKKDFVLALKTPRLSKEDRLAAQRGLFFILAQEKKTGEALGLLSQILLASPNDATLLQKKARLLEQSGKLAEAEQAWFSVLKATKSRHLIAVSHASRASLLARMGKSQAALKELRKASPSRELVDQLDWDTRLRFARLYLKDKKSAQALYYLTRADGSLLPSSQVAQNHQGITEPRYLQTVARLSLELKRYPVAMEALQRLNQQSSRPSDKFKWLGMMAEVAQRNGDKQQALKLYQRALTLKNDADTRIRAADVARELGLQKTVSTLLSPLIKDKSPAAPRASKTQAADRCNALLEANHKQEALECMDARIKKDPQNKSLLLAATQLATEIGDSRTQKEYLAAARSLGSPSAGSISVGDNKALAEQKRSKQRWYENAYRAKKSFKAGYAYANAMLRSGKRDAAIILLSRLVKDPSASRQDKHRAYQSLGYAMAANGDFHGAARSWEKAEQLTNNPALRVRRIWALYKGGKIEKASKLLSTVKLSGLSKKERATWYELRGLIRFQQGQYRDSLTARLQLVKLSPSARHWAQLAESYIAKDDIERADDALENAIAWSHGDQTRYILRRASLKLDNQQSEAATILLTQALQTAPNNPEIEEKLAQAYSELHMNSQARSHLKSAINGYQVQTRRGGKQALLASQKLPQLRRNLAKMNRGFKVSFSHVANSSDASTAPSSTAMLAPFQHEGGSFEISYQPNNIGYRNGKSLEVLARALWSNKRGSASPNGDKGTYNIGIRYKPLAQKNLWFSIEKVIASGSQQEDNWLAASHWSSGGDQWETETTPALSKESSSSRNYHRFHLSLGKWLENEASALAYGEARYGRTWLLSDNWLLSPYLFLSGDGEFGDNSQHRIDSGLGLRAHFRGAYDYYEGYKANNEVYLKLGQTVDSNQTNDGVTASLGIKLSY